MRVSINRIFECAKGLQGGEILSHDILLRRGENQERDFLLPINDWLGDGTLREGLFLLSCVEGFESEKLSFILGLGERVRALVQDESVLVRYVNALTLHHSGAGDSKTLSAAESGVRNRIRNFKGLVRDKRLLATIPKLPMKGGYSYGECTLLSKICALTYFLKLSECGLDEAILLVRSYGVSAIVWEALTSSPSGGGSYSLDEISQLVDKEDGLELLKLKNQFLAWKEQGL